MATKGLRYKKASVVGVTSTFEYDVSRTEEKAKRTPCGEEEEEEHHSNDDARGL